MRGDKVGPACPPAFQYATLDVLNVSFSADMSWQEPDAHSKWGVSATLPILCIGDINRMTTQFVRGGGAACLHNEALAYQFRKAITGTSSCPPADEV